MNRPTVATPPDAASDRGLVDSIRLPEATLNRLFAALLVTTGGVFLSGNLMFLDPSVVERSGLIALASLTVLTIFYTLARSLRSPAWGLVLTDLLLGAMAYARRPWLVALVWAFAACGLLYTLRFLRVARRFPIRQSQSPGIGFCDTRQWGMGMGVAHGNYWHHDCLQRRHRGVD